MKKILPYIICSVFLVLGIAAVVLSMTGQGARIDRQGAEISQLRADLDKAQQEVKADQASEMRNTTGVDVARKVKDDSEMAGLFTRLFSWKDWQSYTDARNYAVQKIGEEAFTEFMPAVAQDSDAAKTFFDQGLSASYQGLNTIVTNVDGDNYTYFAQVDVTMGSSDSQGDATNVITYTVTGDGAIKDFVWHTGYAHGE